MVFAGITVDEAVPALLAMSLSAIALFIFFAAGGQKAGWCKCFVCCHWFSRRGTTVEKRPLMARIGPQPRGLCPRCAKAEGRVLKEDETLSLSE